MSRGDEGDPTNSVEGMVASRRVRRISDPNWPDARDKASQARAHIKSAGLLASTDPVLAMSALHDATRKVVTAHMEVHGLRPESAPGAHRSVVIYARERLSGILDEDQLDDLELIMRARHDAEYGVLASTRITETVVQARLPAAKAIVIAVTAHLAAADPSARRPLAPS
jgi:hypothetical protein